MTAALTVARHIIQTSSADHEKFTLNLFALAFAFGFTLFTARLRELIHARFTLFHITAPLRYGLC